MPSTAPAADRSGIAELRALQAQLNRSIDALVASESPLPSLVSTKNAHPPSINDAITARAAARRLGALLGGQMHTFEWAVAFHVPAALRVAIKAHIAEQLREAEQAGGAGYGVDAEELAMASGIDGEKLARVLRLLAAHDIFREVAPDRFINNQCSLALDTGKTVKELLESNDPWGGTDGKAAFVDFCGDDSVKAAGQLAEVLFDPATSHSYDTAHTAFSRAYGIDTGLWEYLAKEENAHLLRRFGMAMKGTQSFQNSEAEALAAVRFPWKDLPEDAVVVDVGGGVGSLDLEVIKAAPHVKCIIQDRAEVISEGRALWAQSAPQHLTSGRATLMPHDFFTPQPIAGAAVYVLRYIIHDWADERALAILAHLSAGAAPSSRLVLIEQTYAYLSDFATVEGDGLVPSTFPYLLDGEMLVVVNALERTEAQYAALARKAGWELEKVWKTGRGGEEEGMYRHYEFCLAQ
ncbi:hypothetical protein JCM10449v2_006382 [Rhodotorula kratochvilovae]